MKFTTRFAPSPTGPLHLGHAYSALLTKEIADKNQGIFLLRIEDIDQGRSRLQWQQQIFDDLAWLGLTWPQPVLRQSARAAAYEQAIQTLWQQGLLYVCHCSRRDIQAASSAPQEGIKPLYGPDGLIYPGTCPKVENKPHAPLPAQAALRLNMALALQKIPEPDLCFLETGAGPRGETGQVRFSAAEVLNTIGDIVLRRRDMGGSYHLSVVLDDGFQNITHVVRGEDLFEATKIHVVLQHLLGLPTPIYRHHRLIRDETGKRLAKRDDARAIDKFRHDGLGPSDIRALVGLN